MGQDQGAAEYWLTQSARQGNSYTQFLLDHQQHDPSVLLCSVRLLRHMSNIFWETLPPPNLAGGYVESKLMVRIREKKIAMGQAGRSCGVSESVNVDVTSSKFESHKQR